MFWGFFKKGFKIGLDKRPHVGNVSPVIDKEPMLGFANVQRNLRGDFNELWVEHQVMWQSELSSQFLLRL